MACHIPNSINPSLFASSGLGKRYSVAASRIETILWSYSLVLLESSYMSEAYLSKSILCFKCLRVCKWCVNICAIVPIAGTTICFALKSPNFSEFSGGWMYGWLLGELLCSRSVNFTLIPRIVISSGGDLKLTAPLFIERILMSVTAASFYKWGALVSCIAGVSFLSSSVSFLFCC